MSEWKLIETAPREELVLGADVERRYCAVGVVSASGDFEEVEHDGSPRNIGFFPAHWQPIRPPTPMRPR